MINEEKMRLHTVFPSQRDKCKIKFTIVEMFQCMKLRMRISKLYLSEKVGEHRNV